MRTLIPDDAPFVLAPIAGVDVISYQAQTLLSEDQRAADAAVVWGFGSPNLAQLAASPSLSWIQTLTAGPDAVLAAGFGPQVAITSGRGFHDRTVTEHALALALSGLRQIPLALAAQREHRWAGELGGFRPLHTTEEVSTLIGSNVLI